MDSNTNKQIVQTGIVYKKAIGNYFVRHNGQQLVCSLSTKLRRELLYPIADPNSIKPRVMAVKKIDVLDPVAVGDQVRYIDARDGSGLILEVLPRRSQLSRRSAIPMPGARPKEQVIVANLDLVIPVMSAAQPTPKWALLDRYLVSAESCGLPSLVCITKVDLLRQSERAELEVSLDIYRQAGYSIVLTSATTGEGLEALRQEMNNRINVLIGKSGVGKTSLLNALEPDLGLQVNQVNQKTGKGKHTTSNLEMVWLKNSGSVIDTPGMREFGLWDVDEQDLAVYFPEMRHFIGQCRFGLDCTHTHEPDCAIRAAIGAGKIDPYRYQSYLRLRQE